MRQLQRIPLWVWMGGCFVIAAIYTIIWPRETALTDTSALSYIVLRWFHALTWVLLGLSFGVRMKGYKQLAHGLALGALGVYIVFMLTFMTT